MRRSTAQSNWGPTCHWAHELTGKRPRRPATSGGPLCSAASWSLQHLQSTLTMHAWTISPTFARDRNQVWQYDTCHSSPAAGHLASELRGASSVFCAPAGLTHLPVLPSSMALQQLKGPGSLPPCKLERAGGPAWPTPDVGHRCRHAPSSLLSYELLDGSV